MRRTRSVKIDEFSGIRLIKIYLIGSLVLIFWNQTHKNTVYLIGRLVLISVRYRG